MLKLVVVVGGLIDVDVRRHARKKQGRLSQGSAGEKRGAGSTQICYSTWVAVTRVWCCLLTVVGWGLRKCRCRRAGAGAGARLVWGKKRAFP